jgi:hypothetical protein
MCVTRDARETGPALASGELPISAAPPPAFGDVPDAIRGVSYGLSVRNVAEREVGR